MEYGGDPGFGEFDAQWITDGPNSGGVRLILLWRGHLFHVERDFTSSSISRGIAAPEFVAAHRDSSDPIYRGIVEYLDAHGLSLGTGEHR